MTTTTVPVIPVLRMAQVHVDTLPATPESVFLAENSDALDYGSVVGIVSEMTQRLAELNVVWVGSELYLPHPVPDYLVESVAEAFARCADDIDVLFGVPASRF